MDAVTTSHSLKVWREPFVDLWLGYKTLELRKNDRGFHRGDTLTLNEYDQVAHKETGRSITATVTHIIKDSDPVPWSNALRAGWCIMSLRVDSQIDA